MPSINVQLTPAGPIVAMHVGISMPRLTAMKGAGISAPPMVLGQFLIDTGAYGTCVDPNLIRPLGLQPTGSVAIMTPSTQGATHSCNQYDAAVYIPNGSSGGFLIEALPILETQLSAQGIDGLIGRDIINRCTLIYNGSANMISLAY